MTLSLGALIIGTAIAGCGGGGSSGQDVVADTQTATEVGVAADSPAPAASATADSLDLGNTGESSTQNASPSPSAIEQVNAEQAAPAIPTLSVTADSVETGTTAAEATPATDANTVTGAMKAATAAAATGEAAAIAKSDIAVQAVAANALSVQSWGNAQCYGKILTPAQLGSTGIVGSSLPSVGTLRFGRDADSGWKAGYAFRVTVNAADPITAGSMRCELSFPASKAAGVPREQSFWHGFAVKLPDWRNTNDEQAIAQWHAGDTSGGLLPVYTLLVHGKTMRLILRYDTSLTASRNTTVVRELWRTESWQPNQWMTFVTNALIAQDMAKGPFLKAWLNGTQIVNYSGPIGYRQPSVQQYAKHGIYHWVDSTNPWDMSMPTRQAWFKDPAIVMDAGRKYTAAQVRALVER